MTKVTLPYHPRPIQRQLHNELRRFNVICAHRRFGKTCFSINHLIRAAMTNKLKNPRYLFIAPYRSQAKEIAWLYLKDFTRPLKPKFNESELRCDLPNGARIQLAGGENVDALRGGYIDGCVMDEVAQLHPRVWSEVLRPAMTDRPDSFSIMIGTPQGEDNAFYELYQHALTAPNWLARMHKASETGIIATDELEDARRSMSPNQYLQEFECDWGASQEGAIWQNQIQEAAEEGRITNVPYDRAAEVHVAFDLGVSDATTLVFFQLCGQEIHWIDCFSDTGRGLDYYVKKVREKPYAYGKFYFPHDIKVRELSTGTSRIETLRSLGINPFVMPRTPVDDRINAARMAFDKMWFDADKFHNCLRSLRAYKYAYDQRKKMFSRTPAHDVHSHFADAFGLACQTFKMAKPNAVLQQRDRSWIV